MTAVWPESLPQDLRVAELESTFPDGAIRTQMDAGPAIVRGRFTAAVEPSTGRLFMDSDQLQTFMDFWKTTIRMGSLAFEWVDPRTGAACSVRFTGPPRYNPRTPRMVATGVWDVGIAFEVMPEDPTPASPDEFAGLGTEIVEWGPWYHAFDQAPAGEVDVAFMGTTPDLDGSGSGGGSGGGLDLFGGGAQDGNTHIGSGGGFDNNA